MTEDDVRALLKARAEDAGSQRNLAREWGVHQSDLSQMISGAERISSRVLEKIGVVRRSVDTFYPEREALMAIARDVGRRLKAHRLYRKERGLPPRPAIAGFLTMKNIARLFGVKTDDLARLRLLNPDFPSPDAPGDVWRAETIHEWLIAQAEEDE